MSRREAGSESQSGEAEGQLWPLPSSLSTPAVSQAGTSGIAGPGSTEHAVLASATHTASLHCVWVGCVRAGLPDPAPRSTRFWPLPHTRPPSIACGLVVSEHALMWPPRSPGSRAWSHKLWMKLTPTDVASSLPRESGLVAQALDEAHALTRRGAPAPPPGTLPEARGASLSTGRFIPMESIFKACPPIGYSVGSTSGSLPHSVAEAQAPTYLTLRDVIPRRCLHLV